MTVEVKLDEARVRLRDLIEAAIRGEDVFILEDNKPAVRLVPIASAKRNARFGSARGLVSMSDDFDAPLADFGEYMPCGSCSIHTPSYGIDLLGIEIDHLAAVTVLPFHHRDPFDRLLVAQAIAEQMPVVSGDQVFDLYPIQRLW